jgi:hypothetical protein
MAKRITVDHGEIIHFAGAHQLFPVAKRDDPSAVRLASKDEPMPDEVRVGWPVYFRPFIDRRLVFLIDDGSGRAISRAEAEEQLREGAHAEAKLTP